MDTQGVCMDDISKQIGMRIRTLRKSRGLTQEQLGDAAGISDKYLSEVERGGSKVSVEVLNKVADGLKISLHDLLELDQNTRTRDEVVAGITDMLDGASDEQLLVLHRVVKAILL
ncbi:XRE family transcriptional regulator [Marinifilum sp. JC120]|nr:XRE family transcriptional regulator [Marinifilum sp. JC120]